VWKASSERRRVQLALSDRCRKDQGFLPSPGHGLLGKVGLLTKPPMIPLNGRKVCARHYLPERAVSGCKMERFPLAGSFVYTPITLRVN